MKPALLLHILILTFLAWPALSIEGIDRLELRRDDLSQADGTEIIVARLRLRPGATMPRHTHHGDEIVYVIKGGTIEVPGPKQIKLNAGESLRNARGVPHGGFTVIGPEVIEVLTVHVVDKGRPLMVLVD